MEWLWHYWRTTGIRFFMGGNPAKLGEVYTDQRVSGRSVSRLFQQSASCDDKRDLYLRFGDLHDTTACESPRSRRRACFAPRHQELTRFGFSSAAKFSRINTYEKAMGSGAWAPVSQWELAPPPFSSVIIPPRPLHSFPERLPP
jgi:hypothetical protein